jgi:hypothetical protein
MNEDDAATIAGSVGCGGVSLFAVLSVQWRPRDIESKDALTIASICNGWDANPKYRGCNWSSGSSGIRCIENFAVLT